MTMSVGHCPQTFVQDGVCTRSVHVLLSVYPLINCINSETSLNVCSFAFPCSMINKLTFLELKLQHQQLILCINVHLRFQNNGYKSGKFLHVSSISSLLLVSMLGER